MFQDCKGKLESLNFKNYFIVYYCVTVNNKTSCRISYTQKEKKKSQKRKTVHANLLLLVVAIIF